MFNSDSPADLVILSDLHLGEGKSLKDRRYAPNEDFFYDDQFARFIEFLRNIYCDRPNDLRLILNGDTFDFLTVTSVPSDEEASVRRFRVSSFERKFGLNPSAKKSVYKLDRIVMGHRLFFKALAGFLADGFRIEFIRGNHDLELYFESVKNRLLEHLTALDNTLDYEKAQKLVSFHDWFYMEQERIYIEHGNQYDAANSIRYPFHPILPTKQVSAEKDRILDYPLGSILVRFFYNRVRLLDPYSPRIASFDHYISFVKRYNLFDVWKVYKDHYPHFIAALGSAPAAGSSGDDEGENVRQSTDFAEHIDNTVSREILDKLHALKVSPMSASKANVVKEMITAFMRRGIRFFVLAFVVIFLWFGVFQLINLVPGITANAFLLALFAVVTLGGAMTVWIQLDRKLRKKQAVAFSTKMPIHAEQIARVTKVKNVVFGHTHMAEWRIVNNEQSVYANSGTWTSIENPWGRFMKDARRNTFLSVKNDDVTLLRWNDDASRIDEAPLFGFSDHLPMDRLPSVSALDTALSGDMSLIPESPYNNSVIDEDADKED